MRIFFLYPHLISFLTLPVFLYLSNYEYISIYLSFYIYISIYLAFLDTYTFLCVKVNSNNGWEDLLESFELETGTTNGSLALKQTYLR